MKHGSVPRAAGSLRATLTMEAAIAPAPVPPAGAPPAGRIPTFAGRRGLHRNGSASRPPETPAPPAPPSTPGAPS